jgi:mannose-1-phosphate guanylyltransferase
LQAVVLVGGEGTRLRPLTYGTPKPMVPLFGVPFLERTLVRLKQAGIDEVILAAGYLPKAIEDHLGDGSRLGLQIDYVIESEPLGTAGAIKNVAEHITGPFFVLNGDVLTSLDLRGMIAFHKETGGLGALHLIRVDDPSAFGCVEHDASGRISRFIEKPKREEATTDEVNAGTYLLEPEILNWIPVGNKVSIERETFPQLLSAGTPLYAYTTSDYWLDVGRPDQYLQAHRDVLDGKLVLPQNGEASAAGRFWCIGDDAVPAGLIAPAFVGAGVEIDASARVGPYAVLGKDSRVAARAQIFDSVLWDCVIIEHDARLDGSILASGVRIGSEARIATGSVFGHDASVEAGADIPPDSRITAEAPAQL